MTGRRFGKRKLRRGGFAGDRAAPYAQGKDNITPQGRTTTPKDDRRETPPNARYSNVPGSPRM